MASTQPANCPLKVGTPKNRNQIRQSGQEYEVPSGLYPIKPAGQLGGTTGS